MRARVVADTETNRVGVRPGWAAEFGLQTRLEQKVDIQDILFFFYEVLIVFAGNVDIPERLLLSATRHLVDCPSTQSSSEARKGKFITRYVKKATYVMILSGRIRPGWGRG